MTFEEATEKLLTENQDLARFIQLNLAKVVEEKEKEGEEYSEERIMGLVNDTMVELYYNAYINWKLPSPPQNPQNNTNE